MTLLHRRAFTLVEILVVIAIIAMLISLSLPAMQNMRELTRRSQCEQNLVQISLAISSYATRSGHFPIGTLEETGPVKNVADGYHHNWIAPLLPDLGVPLVYEAIDNQVSVYHAQNKEARESVIPPLLCPSASEVRDNTTCYAGMHASTETPIAEDNDGLFKLNVAVRDEDITDGLSHTIMLGEKMSLPHEDLSWLSGTRSSLRNAGHAINGTRDKFRSGQTAPPSDPLYVGGLLSNHPDGVYTLMADGQYKFRSNQLDTTLLKQLTAIADANGSPSP